MRLRDGRRKPAHCSFPPGQGSSHSGVTAGKGGGEGRLARNPPLPRDKNSVGKAEIGDVLKRSQVASFRERTNTSHLQRNRDDAGRGGLRGGQVALSPPEDRMSAPGLLAAAFPTMKDRQEAARTAPKGKPDLKQRGGRKGP